MIHQHRAAYELCGTPYSDFEHTEGDVGLRRKLFELDARMLGECRHVFANSNNTARRLQTSTACPLKGCIIRHRSRTVCVRDRTVTTCSWSDGSKT